MERVIAILLGFSERVDKLTCLTGGYGAFDLFAANCVSCAKQYAANIKNCLVVPYLPKKSCEENFDEIIYPPLENVPPKWAISHRNKWLVGKSDIVICYISHTWGGAAEAVNYARKKNKPVINLYK